jgi:hypothetical protein
MMMALAACLVLFCAAAATQNLLASETTRARALVAEGQRDLAKSDRAGAALAFERARLYAPRADFVRASLAAADVKDAEAPVARALRTVTTREWFALAIAAGWTSGLALALVAWRRPNRRAWRVVFAAAGALAVAVAAIVASNASSAAIVTATDVGLLVAPYPSAATSAAMPAGTMVVVGSSYDDYVQVEDADGRRGWVPRRSIEPVDEG